LHPVDPAGAVDEAVELASIVRGARTLARFITRFFACGGLPSDALPASELLERKAEQ
jgi:hypothetical protein